MDQKFSSPESAWTAFPSNENTVHPETPQSPTTSSPNGCKKGDTPESPGSATQPSLPSTATGEPQSDNHASLSSLGSTRSPPPSDKSHSASDCTTPCAFCQSPKTASSHRVSKSGSKRHLKPAKPVTSNFSHYRHNKYRMASLEKSLSQMKVDAGPDFVPQQEGQTAANVPSAYRHSSWAKHTTRSVAKSSGSHRARTVIKPKGKDPVLKIRFDEMLHQRRMNAGMGQTYTDSEDDMYRSRVRSDERRINSVASIWDLVFGKEAAIGL